MPFSSALAGAAIAAFVLVSCGAGSSNLVRPSLPPAGQPVFLITRGPINGSQLVAYDWTGRVAGYGIRLPSCFESCTTPIPSPDGHLLLGIGTRPVDLVGHAVGHQPSAENGSVWSDDSAHLCGLASAGPGRLATDPYDPKVVDFSLYGSSPDWEITLGPLPVMAGPLFSISCSSSTARAGVVETSQTGAAVVVETVPSGQVITRRTYSLPVPSFTKPDPNSVGLVLSHDYRFLAEDLAGPVLAPGGPRADVRSLPDGALLNRLMGESVAAFSWDASRVVAENVYASAPGEPGYVSVLERRTMRTLWAQPGRLAGVVVQPDGSGLVVALNLGRAGDDIWLVPTSGHPELIASNAGLLSTDG
jgi:hypothetical protein